MAIVLNCWESANVVGSTLTIPKPDSGSVSGDSPKNPAVGDLLIIVIGSDDNSATAQWNDSNYKPTGFTLINEVGDSTRDCHCAAFYRIVDGNEGASFDVPTQSSDDLWGSCILISGNPSLHLTGADCVDGTPPISITGVTCTEADCLAFYVAAYDGGDDGGFSVAGTGWDERAEIRTGTGQGNGAGCWGTRQMSGTGATGTATVSVGLSDGMVGFQFAIAPGEPPINNYSLPCDPDAYASAGVAQGTLMARIIEAGESAYIMAGEDLSLSVPGEYIGFVLTR